MTSKNKFVIVGFVGAPGSGKTTAADILVRKGFHKVSISPKVEQFASYFFTPSQIIEKKADLVQDLRKRGCRINKCYWINQVLSSVSNKNTKIVIDDLDIFETTSRILVYQIVRPSILDTTLYNDVPTIMNDGDLKQFERTVLHTFAKLFTESMN